MSNAKEKAEELLEKFQDLAERHRMKYQDDVYGYSGSMLRENKKKCALITVEEIIQNIKATMLYYPNSEVLHVNNQYWEDVKNELLKINS